MHKKYCGTESFSVRRLSNKCKTAEAELERVQEKGLSRLPAPAHKTDETTEQKKGKDLTAKGDKTGGISGKEG